MSEQTNKREGEGSDSSAKGEFSFEWSLWKTKISAKNLSPEAYEKMVDSTVSRKRTLFWLLLISIIVIAAVMVINGHLPDIFNSE